MSSENPISDKPSLQYDIPASKILALNCTYGELEKRNATEEAFSKSVSRSAGHITRVRSEGGFHVIVCVFTPD